MSNIESDRELAALEAALRALTPRTAAVDRDQLFFRAGQTSARSHRWVWPSVAGLLALAVGTLGGLLAVRPVETVERVVVVREQVEPPVAKTVAPAPSSTSARPESVEPERSIQPIPLTLPGTYLHQRDLVLSRGFDALPAPVPIWGGREPAHFTTAHDPLLNN